MGLSAATRASTTRQAQTRHNDNDSSPILIVDGVQLPTTGDLMLSSFLFGLPRRLYYYFVVVVHLKVHQNDR